MGVIRNVAWLLVLALATMPSPSFAEGPAKQGLPRLGNPSAAEEVSGTIADSTRGRDGPVRLVLRIPGGSELAALVAPDPVCDALGLSLRKGEEVTLVGQMITTGDRPLFVTQAVVVDGSRIAVRGANGGWAEAPETASAEAGDAADEREATPEEEAKPAAE